MKSARSLLPLLLFLLSTANSHGATNADFRIQCAAKFQSLVERVLAEKTAPEGTALERELANIKPAPPVEVQLEQAILQIEKSDPKLAAEIRSSMVAKAVGGEAALRIDISDLPNKMQAFIDGPFKSVAGPRGISKPFVSIKAVGEDALLIEHEGDKFSHMIRWADVKEPTVGVEDIDGVSYRTLTLPQAMTHDADMHQLKPQIFDFLSDSRMHPYIDSNRTPISQAAALLHDGKTINDRPSQLEFRAIREKLDSDPELRRKENSMLFVAPTAAGKTRVLGTFLEGKILSSQMAIESGSSKKLTIIMANTPDLTNQLGLTLGKQIRTELGGNPAARFIQWGGDNTDKMTLEELNKFISESSSPVVLVTNYQTLASRVKTDAEMKALFEHVNGIGIDEAHNSGGQTFDRVMRIGNEVANQDRAPGKDIKNSLEILGTTASPINRTQRTVDVFQQSYWASDDPAYESPSRWAQRVLRGQDTGGTSSLDYQRVARQLRNARNNGEITAPESAEFFDPRENGFDFDSIFSRTTTGNSPTVDLKKLQQIWPSISKAIKNQGTGVVLTYPRDADKVAALLTELSKLSDPPGKNFVSLQGLSVAERTALTEAFQKHTLYKGMHVDAIVGKIREGLDFPDAGFYLSFKKYVKFPENIQSPGRVMRLAYDKPTPKIIFFGQDLDSKAASDVRDLVMKKLGPLPSKLVANRGGIVAARNPSKSYPDSTLGKAIPGLTDSMEALFRLHPEQAKAFANAEKLNPDDVAALQAIVLKARSSGANWDISIDLKNFIYQINSFPFFQGNLKKTWALADKLLDKDVNIKKLSPEELAIFNDPEQMKQLAEFRAMKSWIGPSPRTILQDMSLSPNGLREMGRTLDAFVARNGRIPVDSSFLGGQLRQLLDVSGDELYRELNPATRLAMEPLFQTAQSQSIEQTLSRQVTETGHLPNFYFGKLDSGVPLTLTDRVNHKLADRLRTYLQTGKLDIAALTPAAKTALDSSEIYKQTAQEITQAIQSVADDLLKQYGRNPRLAEEMSYDHLVLYDQFGFLKVLNTMAKDSSHPNSQAFKSQIEALLKEKFGSN